MKRLPVTPLPAKPTWLDRIEFAMQWCMHWSVFTDERHPMFAGLLTGVCLVPWVIAMAVVVGLVLKIIS